MSLELWPALIMAVVSASAGFFDAIVGGGGLIMLPALMAVFPNAAPVQLFATNKSGSVWGTALAAAQYARRVQLPWRVLAPAFLAAALGSALGAWTLGFVSAAKLRQILPVVLAVLLVYTLVHKNMGQTHAPKFALRTQIAIATGFALVIGFYDGFFGPGTGSFFVFCWVRLLGFDFLHASACAKWLNMGTNIFALILFAWQGQVWWHYAVVLAVANMLGSLVGTRLALKHGAGFVRWAFIAMVFALLCKTAWDAWKI